MLLYISVMNFVFGKINTDTISEKKSFWDKNIQRWLNTVNYYLSSNNIMSHFTMQLRLVRSRLIWTCFKRFARICRLVHCVPVAALSNGSHRLAAWQTFAYNEMLWPNLKRILGVRIWHLINRAEISLRC